MLMDSLTLNILHTAKIRNLYNVLTEIYTIILFLSVGFEDCLASRTY